jgi:hypothetical protein
MNRLAGQRARAVQRASDAEVDDSWTLGRQQDVRRLEVPVHDPGAVDVSPFRRKTDKVGS